MEHTLFNCIEKGLKHFRMCLVLESHCDRSGLSLAFERLILSNGRDLIEVEGRNKDAVSLGSLEQISVDVAFFNGTHHGELFKVNVEKVHWGLIHGKVVRLRFLPLDLVILHLLAINRGY